MKPAPTSRLRRWLWITVGLALTYTLVGFLLLPVIVKSQLQQRLSAELGRTTAVGAVRINPFTLSVTLEDFDLREADGKSSFVAWRRLHVDFEALASLGGSWVLGEVALDGLQSAVLVKPDGSLNFSDLLARLAAKPAAPAAAPGRPLHVGQLRVTQARCGFTDQSRSQPFATVIGPLNFTVHDFHTGGARGAPYRFEAATEKGEKLSWTGTLHAAPFRSAGEFRLENILLPKYAPYHRELTLADLTEGTLTLSGRYDLNLGPGTRVMQLRDGAVQLRDLKVLERGSQELALALASLEVSAIQADALTLRADVGAVALRGGRVHVRRDPAGAINLVSMFLLPPGPPAAAPAPAPTIAPTGPARPAPAVSVGDFSLQDFTVEVTDRAAPRPASLTLSSLACSLKSISLADGAVMPLQAAFNWAPRGTVRVAGSVSIKPEIKAQLKTEVTGLELLPLSPYLEQFVNARLTQGAVSTTHTVDLALAGGVPAITLEGGLSLEKFGVVDSAHNQELAGVGSLALKEIKLATTPSPVLSIAEVNLVGPYARLAIHADKSLNLAALARTPAPAPGPTSAPAPAPTAAATPAAPAPAPRITIGQIVISQGDFSFSDRSITPQVRTSLGQFGGTIAGLSSENAARADVALQGSVDGTGPLTIRGRLDPLGASPFVDLTVTFQNVDLVPLSPYSGKFAGFELARGKLGVDTRFQLDGKKIDATNVVQLDRFTFGAPVASPDATKLPVRLGVALLKDLNGRIVIDLPIQGKLDDPEFKIGRVVGRVLGNLLAKAAVSPFTMLGSMFGGGGDELAFQEFAPGRSALQPAELPKLATMIKALANRPELGLALEGSYDSAADTHALKQVKLADLIRRSAWEARRAMDPNVAPPEQFTLTPTEEAAMVKTLFDRKFPPGTEFGTPLPQAPAVVQPPAAPAGFFQRMVRTLTGRAKREALAAQTENDRRAAEHQKAVAAANASGRPLDEMLGRLAETIEVQPADLEALAATRARQVRDHLVTQGAITPDRLFLAQSTDATRAAKGPRVFLSLQ